MAENDPNKTRSSLEVGAVFAIVGFVITLAFNAGIQYGQISNLKAVEESHTAQINEIKAQAIASDQKQEVQNNLTNVSLAHIETIVEQLKATQELRATGAMR